MESLGFFPIADPTLTNESSVVSGRVKGMSVATDNFVKSVLSGVISTVGYVPNAIVKSRVGRKFFKTGPGEVALASLVSFCMYQTCQRTSWFQVWCLLYCCQDMIVYYARLILWVILAV
jgi:hypothetical protein